MKTVKDTSELLNYHVSYQASAWSEISSECTIRLALDKIKSCALGERIETLRGKLNDGDNDYYDKYKKWLPAVTYCGTFNQRRQLEYLISYNSIVIIDIDALSENQIVSTQSVLLNDEFVFSFWRSPSNRGFKGLISVTYSIESEKLSLAKYHKRAFEKVRKHFQEKYDLQIDKSGSDVTRLCFLSSDDELVLKTHCNEFSITEKDLEESKIVTVRSQKKKTFGGDRDILFNPLDKNNRSNRKIMSDIIRYLDNKKLSITYSYDDWFKAAMAIANSFTFEIGLKYFTKLSAMDSDKFNNSRCENFLINCYETSRKKVSFNSLVYMANAKGYKTKFQRNGVPKVGD